MGEVESSDVTKQIIARSLFIAEEVNGLFWKLQEALGQKRYFIVGIHSL